MSYKGCHLIFSLLSLSVFWINSTGGQTSNETSCVLSVPNNLTLFTRLSSYFHKESTVIIVEYNITFNNVSSKFNLLNQSRPNAFQPWKWYRTQGFHSSYLLLSYDNYFGALHRLLHQGVKKESVQLDVSPPDCLDQLRNESLELVIRKFLLSDFDITGDTWRRKFINSEDIKICSAGIGSSRDGFGKLVFNCCDINYEKYMSCDDITADEWVTISNILMLILTCFLVILFPLFIDGINSLYGDEIYNHRLPEELRLDIVKTAKPDKFNTYPNKIILEKKKWEKMETLKSKVEPWKSDQIKTARVRAVSCNVARHKLFNKHERTHSIKRLLNWIINCKPNNSKCRLGIVILRRLLFLIIVTSLNVPLMVSHFNTDTMFKTLMKAYEEHGLRGSFYFQWSDDGPIQNKLLVALYIFLAVCAIYISLFTPFLRNQWDDEKLINDCFKDKLQNGSWKVIFKKWLLVVLNLVFIPPFIVRGTRTTQNDKYCCTRMVFLKIITGIVIIIILTPVILTLFIGIHFVLHSLFMMIFTIIVEVDIYYGYLNISVFVMAFILEFFHDLGENFNPLKKSLIGMFKEKCINNDNKNTIHALSARMIDDDLSRNIPDNIKAAGSMAISQTKELSQEERPGDETDNVTTDNSRTNGSSQKKQTADLHIVSVQDLPQNKNILEIKGDKLVLKVAYACIFISEHDILCVSRKFLLQFPGINCIGAPRTWNILKTVATYFVFAIIVFTIIASVGAYGHPNHIIRGHFTTLAAGFVVFAIKRLSTNAKSVSAIKKRNRRFLSEIKEKMQSYDGNLRVFDFTEIEIPKANDSSMIDLLVLEDNTTKIEFRGKVKDTKKSIGSAEEEPLIDKKNIQ